MDSLHSPDQETLRPVSQTYSLIFMLERGLDCTRQGSYIEGAAFLSLAHDQLPPDQLDLALMIETFLQSQANFSQAQQSLFLASKRFTEADTAHKSQLLVLEKLLQNLNEEPNTIARNQEKAQRDEINEAHQLQEPPKTLQPATENSNSSNGSNEKPSLSQVFHKQGDPLPDLYITCFGHFEVKRFDQSVVLCQSRNGQAILRFLVAQAGYRASVDKLMDVLWTHDTPEVARRKLQIAISAIRGALNTGYHCDTGEGYILYKDGFYQLNPAVTIHTDVEEFLALWQAGQQVDGSESVAFYEKACNLCIGAFLVEDTYADWSFARREQLKQIYFSMCRALAEDSLKAGRYEDALKRASEIVKEDRCDEQAHRQLMHIYSVQGHRSEALRQYQRCKHNLAEELGVLPSPETTNLLQTLLTNVSSPTEKIERK